MNMDMTNPYARFAPLMIILVMALGAVNWYFTPELSTKWAMSIFFLPIVWGGIQILKLVNSNSTISNQISRELLAGITGAGLILAITLTLKLAQSQAGLSEVWEDRLAGAAMGGVLVVIGNYLPKKLRPLGAENCSLADTQAMQRFAGWTFVLGGLAFTAAWLFLPADYAHTVAISAGVISLLLVMGRWLWVSYRAGRS